MRILPALGVGLASLGLAWTAGAVGTRVFDLDTLDKLSGGDLKGVQVSSDGRVRAGLTLGNVPLPDATAVYAALTLPDGSVLVGTSFNGKVLRVAGDQATVWAETKQTAVTSLALGANGVVYASTIPDGKIFKVTAGKVDLLTTLPETSHVWALAWDKTKSALFAATGNEAKVFRVTLDGQASTYFTTDEPNLVSLAVDDQGAVYAGSQGKGLLYKITGPGRATVIYDFPGEEVKAIAFGSGKSAGTIYAVSNEYGELPEVPHRSSGNAHAAAGPNTAARPKPGKGTLYKFDAQLRPEKLMHHDEFHYVALAVGDDGLPYVGTGAEGRVYAVDDAHVVTLVADTDERQIGALSLSGPHPFVVAGDPAVFHRVLGRGGADAVWTSKALDAGLRAKFGVLRWTATGALEFSTRTGNTQTPDATWSPWSNGTAQPAAVASPAARFVQVRARWAKDPAAALGEVVLPFVTENVRPILLEVTAAPKVGLTKEPTKENLPASGGELARHDATVKLSWKVDDPDNDPLHYRIAFRREEQTLWRAALADGEWVTKTDYEWDTSALPEGKYRVKVSASDEEANAPGEVLTHELESAPFLVDNTPPVVQSLSMAGRILRARVVDGAGPIVRIEVAVDGKPEWRPLAAVDGVLDSADESVDTDVSSVVPAGSHIVAVRAFDAAGNAVSREIESR
ncbi:MAG TPA: hypothetical protein VGI39_44660 [Polyangiaceae bacterium]|jgi:hypothetical protein